MATDDPAPQPGGTDAPGREQEGRMVMVTFPMSAAVHFELKARALQDRTTVKAIVMRALREIGVDVPEDELTDRRTSRAARARGR